MRRTVYIVFAAAALGLAPSAVAKGPHAIVSSGPAGIEPGRPWVTTLMLFEYGRRAAATARPTVVLRSGDERFTVRPRRLGAHIPRQANVVAEVRYRLRVVFPRAGRWSYTVLDGTPANRRFRFPGATIGGKAERVTTGYAAFPVGSRAANQGAGGPLIGGPGAGPDGGGEPLPPEVVLPPAEDSEGGGASWWIPAAGLTLAGVGTLTVLRRRRRAG
jgi:MYXO-CTERM domain-containing protein